MPKKFSLTLATAIKERWSVYHKMLRRCKKNFSEKNVHDFRVAIRRFIAALLIAESMKSIGAFSRIKKRLKNRISVFGELRDIQVVLNKIREVDSKSKYTFLMELKLNFESKEKELRKRLRVKISRWKDGEIKRLVKKANGELMNIRKPEFNSIEAMLLDSYKVLVNRIRAALNDDPYSIHRVRIALRKLRYKVEILKSILIRPTEKNIELMQLFQKKMGEIQDLTVMIDTIRREMEKRLAFDKNVYEYLIELRRKRIEVFMKELPLAKRFKPAIKMRRER
ncbi:TPA: hypothetical protein DEF17_09235 [bacterium]|nr:MAG: hypothetical protein AUJ18_03105 [Candidatus Hydrogenedentes bacterium CG1_02_42_14]PIU48794.1 MAG: hypothetical protein COS94_00340 [Candidatus Hydrogenedentes bacterium CG07_land_8_20_14_0_80_42_17]HBW48091.1 hypothetical protein [bacterium]